MDNFIQMILKREKIILHKLLDPFLHYWCSIIIPILSSTLNRVLFGGVISALLSRIAEKTRVFAVQLADSFIIRYEITSLWACISMLGICALKDALAYEVLAPLLENLAAILSFHLLVIMMIWLSKKVLSWMCYHWLTKWLLHSFNSSCHS